MNRALQAEEDQMFNYTDMTVLERQRARFKCHQYQFLDPQQQLLPDHHHSLHNANFTGLLTDPTDSVLHDGWLDSVYSGFVSGQPANFGFPAVDLNVKESISSEKMSGMTSRSESFKKRKSDKGAKAEEGKKEKKIKRFMEEEGEESKITEQYTTSNNNNKSINKKPSSSSKDNSKVTDSQKQDYIHVRARRGQATDSHSLAERVRREKISERMKYLQDLVPGCDKITGKAGMLDEIINYVQSLQRQVEFLSMKLAAVNPRLDFDIDEVFPKEILSGSSSNFQNISVPTSLEMTNPNYHHQLNPLQQMVSCSGMDMVINPNSDTSFRRTDDETLAIPQTFYDPSCFPQLQPTSSWDADFQNLYNNNLVFDQGRSSLTSVPPQPFTGFLSTNNLKMEI